MFIFVLLSLIVLIIVALISFNPQSVSAQIVLFNTFFIEHPSASWPAGSIGQLLSRLLPNVVVLAGIISFLLIILGGFQLIIYGGQYNAPAKVSQAKNLVTYGLMGFLLVLAAYFILQIVSTITGINFMDPNVN